MTKSHRVGGARFFAGSSEASPKAAVTGYNPHGKVRTAFQQMQDESRALDRKLAKCERRKKEELMERIEKAETRQRDVQVRYNSIKAEMNNRSMEAIKSYRHEVENRKSKELQVMQKAEQDNHRAFLNYLTERKDKKKTEQDMSVEDARQARNHLEKMYGKIDERRGQVEMTKK